MPDKKKPVKLLSKSKKSVFSYIPPFLYTPKNLIIITLLVLAVLFWAGRNYFIVAYVNGQPVSRFELNSRLNSQFAESVIEQLINERLILSAARQQGIFITSAEIENRIKEIEGNLQGKMTLPEALNLQGLTPNSFRHQLELQLSIEKIFAGQATVSATEISEYLDNNESLFPEATDPAKLRVQVEGLIKQQKMSSLYEEWFKKIRQDAKITKNI